MLSDHFDIIKSVIHFLVANKRNKLEGSPFLPKVLCRFIFMRDIKEANTMMLESKDALVRDERNCRQRMKRKREKLSKMELDFIDEKNKLDEIKEKLDYIKTSFPSKKETIRRANERVKEEDCKQKKFKQMTLIQISK